MAHPEIPSGLYRQLTANLQGEVHADLLTRALYSTDASIYQIFPLAVVYPRTTADLEVLNALASEASLPLIMRGAGTGLAGETLGEAIVADCSQHMHRITSIDPAAGLVQVQPGVVLERLNSRLAEWGKRFGPDPGSASRCTMGGMVANNAAGMRSLLHGVTRDQLVSLELILSDGSRLTVGQDAPEPIAGSPGERIVRGVRELLERHADLIERKTPRRLRRHRAGYLLHDVFVDGRLDLSRLVCGSEGTLATIASATLRVVDSPARTGLALFNFRTAAEAADAVPLVLPHDPAAVEMLDRTMLDMAREAKRLPPGMVSDDAGSVMMVEFAGATDAEVSERLERLSSAMRADAPILEPVRLAVEPARQELIRAVRASGEPLLYRRPGRRHPITCVEDVAVAPDDLGRYVRELNRIYGIHGVDVAIYGHAGAGVLHVRPYFDLRDPRDRDLMQETTREVYRTALAMGGSVSGEHGDGLTRTQFLPDQYGELYPVFGEIKRLFDPKGILNPDKIWRDPPRDSLLENLRACVSRPTVDFPARLAWRRGELDEALIRCNGCGECRTQACDRRMCPINKDAPGEAMSPRGRANLMRSLADGTLDRAMLDDDDVREILDSCLYCRNCSIECPAGGDAARLVLEGRLQQVLQNGQSFQNLFFAMSDWTSWTSSQAPWIVNRVMGWRVTRRLLEATLGVDARRPLPTFERASLSRLRAACPHPERPVAKVALFLDLFARYNDVSLVRDFLEIMRRNDVEVAIPPQRSVGLPAMAYGTREVALWCIEANARSFSPWIERGYRVVALEPSAAEALREDAPMLSDRFEVRKLASSTQDAMAFLAELQDRGMLRTDLLREGAALRVGRHTPCHVRMFGGAGNTDRLLELVPGLEVVPIEAGCCGIAGTWGMKRKNYDRSMRIGQKLFDALKAEGIDCGVSECSTCRMQMEHGSGKRAVHPIALLARAFRDD